MVSKPLGLFDPPTVTTKPIQKSVQKKRTHSSFAGVQDTLARFQLEDKGGYITQEFQDFGYRLAVGLNDMSHKSLYMRLAKKIPRTVLERALSFVCDAPKVKSKPRLFMWKLKQLTDEKKP